MASWNRFDAALDRIEQALLTILSCLMILIAFSQIVLRNLFDTGLTWGDPLVRNLVLWVGFIGAALATREGKHINMDVVSRWLPEKMKIFVGALTSLFSFLICVALAYAAMKFIRNEAQMGNFFLLNVPSWVPQLILPMTFGLMALRFGSHALQSFSKALRKMTGSLGDEA